MARDPKPPKIDKEFRIADRTVDVALAASPVPLRVLDVGCGSGVVLRELIDRVPYAEQYVGVDPSVELIAQARRAGDDRLDFVHAAPHEMPFPAGRFDLIVSSMVLHTWTRTDEALREIARVLSTAGRFVLVDEGKPAEITAQLERAGFAVERQEVVGRANLVVPRVRAYVAGA